MGSAADTSSPIKGPWSSPTSPFGRTSVSPFASPDLSALLLGTRENTDTQPAATTAAAGAPTSDGTQATTALAFGGHKASLRAGATLAQICERSLIEHQLAACHFKFLNFCKRSCLPARGRVETPFDNHASSLLCPPNAPQATRLAGVFFVPLNLSIAAASILALIGDPDNDATISFMNTGSINIVVGCIAAFSVFWNSVERLLNFKSRTDMHEAAKQLCKELLDDLDFTLVRFQSLSNEERIASEKPWGEQDLNEIKAKLDHLQLSCTSPIPDRISQAFKHMNTLVAYYLDINSLDEADRSDAQAVRIANVLLCNEITKSWLWPMKLPRVANVTRRAQKAFERGMERGRKKDKEEALVEAAAAAEARAGAAASGAV